MFLNHQLYQNNIKKLADETEIMEVTAGDMNQIKNVLASFDISANMV